MKKLFFNISILFFLFSQMMAQEAEIILPEVTTYIPSSVEQKLVITAEEIESSHFEDLGEVLESKGIQMLSYGPYGLESKPSIRGFTDETVRVVIDGICVNNAQYGTFDFSTINLSAVERIEIVRGGFTEGVEDEGAVGGVIYLTMKKTEMNNSLKADAAIKTFFNTESFLDSAFQKLSFTGRLGENTFLNSAAGLNYAGNKYLYKITREYELTEGAFGGAASISKNGSLEAAKDKSGYWVSQKNSQVTDGQANANLTHYFGDGNYISIGDAFYAGHKNTPGLVNTTNPGLQRDYNNNVSVALWNPAVARLFNLKNNVAWLCNNRFYKDKSGLEDSRHFINTFKYTGTVDFTSLAGGRLRQLAGMSVDYTKLDSTNDGQHFQLSGVLKETSKFTAGADWTFSMPLAVKFCLNDDKLNAALVPKLGVSWEDEKGSLQFFADVYRMVQFPNMDDLFWEGGGFHGNPDLKPESGWGADLGIKLKGKYRAGLTVFSDYYKDKIRWGNGKTENLSSAFYLGFDFNLGSDFFDGFLSLDLNGEYLYNCLLDKQDQYTYGKRIMWTPDLVWSLDCTLNFELVRVKLNTQYTGPRYTDNKNIYYLKPYLLVNLSAEGAEIGGKFVPYLKLENLLNWQYQSVDGYSMPGISLTIGGRYCFF